MDTLLRGLKERGYEPNHIIDVGASHGAWTNLALKYWPGSRYTLFEPLSEQTPHLAALASAHTNVSWFPSALGKELSRMPLSIYPEHLDAASLIYSGPTTRDVLVEPLDSFLQSGQIPPADMLKIDVQGFEHEVLLGARNTIKQIAVVVMEAYFFRCAPSFRIVHETVAVMNSLGFRVYEFTDPLPRPRDGALGQCDICFVREGHSLLSSESWN